MKVKLKPEVKADWVAALRSDRFKQTTGYLCDGAGHCCLGVLAELAVEAGATTKDIREGYNGKTEVWYGEHEMVPGFEILEWATGEALADTVRDFDWDAEDSEFIPWVTLRDGDPAVDNEDIDRTVSLVALNDNAKWSFAQIADIIEEQL